MLDIRRNQDCKFSSFSSACSFSFLERHTTNMSCRQIAMSLSPEKVCTKSMSKIVGSEFYYIGCRIYRARLRRFWADVDLKVREFRLVFCILLLILEIPTVELSPSFPSLHQSFRKPRPSS